MVRMQAPHNERTPTSVGRVAAELALGVVGAWVGAFFAYNIAEAIADDVTVKGDESYSPAGNVGFIIGSALGSTATVYTIGSIGPARGSPWATLLGAGIPTTILLVGLDDPYLPLYGSGLVAPLQSLGATTGFNVTRR